MKIAITGNIASGKTQVELFLAQKGYKVLDTDIVAHQLLESDAIRKEIVENFKPHNILENNQISRPKLGQIVFNDSKLKEKLEEIIHPKVADKIKEFFGQNINEKLIFVTVPQLFEAKMQNLFDKILLIYANDETRLKRLMERSHFSEEEANIRLNAQMIQEEKKKLSDYIIENNESIEDLENKIEDFLMRLYY